MSTDNVTLFGSMHSVLSSIVMYSISESWILSCLISSFGEVGILSSSASFSEILALNVRGG